VHGNDQLLAFVALNDGRTPAADILQSLRAKLPEYMIPSRVEVLPSIPLTSNGKVDYRRLEAIGHELLRV
jgi:acyl-CoA synthetase (AMP-forming)/AMP-acid ligase II